ncbi:MAG: hypothetical protein LBO09_02310 [Candidatus Peribacteria bacterium]|jgi:hypothetical protein|nr:hypothetical protein [Candidatus Peribacteria bacterium]
MRKKAERLASSLVKKLVDDQLDNICNRIFNPLVFIGLVIVEIALLCTTVYIGTVCWGATSTALTIGMAILGALTTALMGIGAIVLVTLIIGKRFVKKLLEHFCKKYILSGPVKSWIQSRIKEIGIKIQSLTSPTEARQLQAELGELEKEEAELETLLK